MHWAGEDDVDDGASGDSRLRGKGWRIVMGTGYGHGRRSEEHDGEDLARGQFLARTDNFYGGWGNCKRERESLGRGREERKEEEEGGE